LIDNGRMETLGRTRWPLSFCYACKGVSLSFVLVAGFLALRCFQLGAPLSATRIAAEIDGHGPVYVYLTLSSLGLLTILGVILGRREEVLFRSALTDPGTCLPNRRCFEDRLAREIACVNHTGAGLALLIIDVDRLKALNDRFGHEAGDAALRLVAESLRCTCRSRDLAARWGGDEFVILAPGTSAGQALTIAERLRTTLRHLVERERATPISVSIGIADLTTGASAHQLFAAADAALYGAKASGRDAALVAIDHLQGGELCSFTSV
jgi:diguanylate cyclase (GGDEF)-like protein